MALDFAPVRANSEISRPRCKSVANYWVKTGVILSVLTSDLRLRNALDYLPRKADDDCRQELRWLYDRRNLKEAEQDLQAWLTRWATRYPKLTDWVEAHIGETLNFYSLPRQHHKHLKSTNMLERLNEEIKRRTRVVRIFPNAASCLRLVRALCAEVHEAWLEDHRYLNMEYLKEQKKELRTAA